MKSDLQNGEVVYFLELGRETVEVNQLLGRTVKLTYQGRINCVVCGKETKKSFGQGFCYHCFTTAPEADECILRPERCRAHLGISRDMEWSHDHCLQPHIVYLAVSGGLKVGVTRESQIPYRWIDQGAARAMPLCRTPNRHVAGVIESFLMARFGDKTNWKKMISNTDMSHFDLASERRKALSFLPLELRQYETKDPAEFHTTYPVLTWPEKPAQVNLDKENTINAGLKGIRGQYLIFDDQSVFNVRRFSGYYVEMFS
ncbi:MAG: DUF2797 domain-containing protein [Marinilabilia sp.]